MNTYTKLIFNWLLHGKMSICSSNNAHRHAHIMLEGNNKMQKESGIMLE